MSLTKKVWEGMWTGTAAAVIENGLRIPRMMVVTRVLGPELYGILGVFGMFRQTAGLFIQMGTGDAVIRGLAASRARDNRLRIGATMGAAALIRLATIGLCVLSLFFFEDRLTDFLARYPAAAHVSPGEIHWLLRLLLIGIAVEALEGPFGNALQGFQAWRALLAVRIVGAVASTGLPILAALLGYRLLGIVVSQQIAFVVIAAAIFYHYLKIVRPALDRPSFRDSLNEIRPVLTFGVPLILSQLFNLIYTYTDQIMLAGMARVEELSYYEVARNAALMLVFVPTLLRSVMFPASAEFFADRDVRRLEALFSFMVKHLFWFLIPLAVWMSALSPLAIAIIAGERYLAAAPALSWLAMLMVMRAFGVPFFTCLVGALGRTRDQFLISAAGGGLNVLLNYHWIPRWGFMGAVYATATGHVLSFSLAVLLLRPHMRLRFPLRTITISFSCAALGGLMLQQAHLLSPWLVPVMLPLVIVGYFAGVVRLGLLDTQDMAYLERMIPRALARSAVRRWLQAHLRETPRELKL
jgi:O-antigen/teichoic acid export membrane protein